MYVRGRVLKPDRAAIIEACPLLTFRSVWDEFNREHNGTAAANGVWAQIDLQWGREGKGRGDETKEGKTS